MAGHLTYTVVKPTLEEVVDQLQLSAAIGGIASAVAGILLPITGGVSGIAWLGIYSATIGLISAGTAALAQIAQNIIQENRWDFIVCALRCALGSAPTEITTGIIAQWQNNVRAGNVSTPEARNALADFIATIPLEVYQRAALVSVYQVYECNCDCGECANCINPTTLTTAGPNDSRWTGNFVYRDAAQANAKNATFTLAAQACITGIQIQIRRDLTTDVNTPNFIYFSNGGSQVSLNYFSLPRGWSTQTITFQVRQTNTIDITISDVSGTKVVQFGSMTVYGCAL